MKLKKSTKALIYLSACALQGQAPDLRKIPPEKRSSLFGLAHRHSLGAAVACALESAPDYKTAFTPEEQKKWTSVRAAAIKRRVLFDSERELLLKILEKNKIWYCPLKGIILQELYPIYEMREMADNDILFCAKKRDDLKKIMLSEGYTLEDHGVTNHDMYTKEPVYNFEFHTRLFMHTFSTAFTKYYEDIESRLLSKGSPYSLQMSDEDFYIYMLAHAYKHYNEGGTGIRPLTDIYVFEGKYGEALDHNYISKECRKLGMSSFYRIMRNLSLKLFSDPENVFKTISSLSPEEKDTLSFMSYTGSYGNKEEFIKSRMKRSGSKGRYILSRLIPDENYYKEAHPYLYKNKILIPAFLVKRGIKMLLKDRDKIKRELKVVLRS